MASEPGAGPSGPIESTLPPIYVSGEDPHKELREKSKDLNESLDKALLPKFGATAYGMDQEAVDELPQGKNTPLDKVLLQTPGVSYDSAVSNPDFHVRNEYANVQYRINGIQLPDGVSGLGPVLETGFIGRLELLDGVLPAQYGLRTAGVVDIRTKSKFANGGSVDMYGGSLGTFSPSLEAGGSSGLSQWFLTARYQQSDEGLENAMPTPEPIHDHSQGEKAFIYASTIVGDCNRLTFMGGTATTSYQIPDVAGRAPLAPFGNSNLSSTDLDENETDRFGFGILALQTHQADLDTQLSFFTRYASVDFVPDVTGDLVFNNVASTVTRRSLLDGGQFDAAWRASTVHTLRAGLAASAEQTKVGDFATVLLLDAAGNPTPATTTRNDADSELGWNLGGYLQDEWSIRPDLILNTGLRYDELIQFVTAGQISPRVALIWKTSADSEVHAGVARYFTPPMQAQASPTDLALYRGTTLQPGVPLEDPVRPERATVFDVGAELEALAGLRVGADVYFKRASDQLDDGQFGQAVVLTQFNYARGFSRGLELKLDLRRGGLRVYANLAAEKTQAESVVTNQYLVDPDEFDYLSGHYIYTDDAQTYSASTGASYRSGETLMSLDGIFGSGLRTGFANLEHVPGYVQWNAAVARDFQPWDSRQPLTVRLSLVNLFDRSYLLRSGTGIGEFAPQYGPRRGVFLGLTQQF